jgi:hypothetical protein
MQDEVERIPEEEGFRQGLVECEKMYVDVRVLFVEFKQQIRGQEVPEDEQARVGRRSLKVARRI